MRCFAYSSSVHGDADAAITVVGADGATLATKELPGAYTGSLSISGDGATVAITAARRVRADPAVDVVTLWDWRNDVVAAELPIKATYIAYDPTGRFLTLTRDNDGRAEILDATTGAAIATLDGSPTPLLMVAFRRTANGW